MSFDATAAARALLAARHEGRPAGPMSAGLRPETLADGVAAQHALAGLLGAVPPAGFKIGATSLTMQAYLGVSAPMAGFMEAANLHASGASLAFATLRGPGVECELGVRLARALPAGPTTPAEARAAVGDLFAAIEVVENRYGPPPAGDLKAVGTPTIVADQVFHAAAVLGPPADWQALDLEAIVGRITVDGVERGRGLGRDLLGGPMQALAWLAGSPEVAAFGGLRAGQVVMLGSVTPPIWLDSPVAVAVQFDHIPPSSLTIV